MRQLKRFNFELHLARRVAEISSQVAELRRLRELVRLAKRRQGVASAEGANLQFENRRAVLRASTSYQAIAPAAS